MTISRGRICRIQQGPNLNDDCTSSTCVKDLQKMVERDLAGDDIVWVQNPVDL